MARMSDFEYDVWQKKILARNARYKKNGSKSKKCTLPSDHLTKKEREAMNGEVKSLKLTEKYTYKEFKSFSYDMQKEYLDSLRERYGINLKEIQNALFPETTYKAFGQYCLSHGLSKDFPKKAKARTEEQNKAWSIWLHDIPVEDVAIPIEKEEKKQDSPPEPVKRVAVTNLTGSFTGPCSVNDICQQLYDYLTMCRECTVSDFYFNVTFEKENENE